MNQRGSGILLHITSLPSPYGIGDLGPGAYEFVDFLADARQSFWQILPLNPTSPEQGNSPYSSYSAFAGNPLLISPDLLVQDRLLANADLAGFTPGRQSRVDYGAVTEYKNEILATAYKKSIRELEKDPAFKQFCDEHSHWLEDYALFIALREHFKTVDWGGWPRDLKDRKDSAIREWKDKLADRMLKEKFIQYLFFRQWVSLKKYCRHKNVKIIGDLPIYVTYDSSDVWANPEIFKLDDEKKSTVVAGVPPDYFSATGQLWGNPVYDWGVMKETGYAWWIKRLEHNLQLFDLIRLDHFRGFVAYWEVQSGEETAINGRWVETPVEDFFKTLFKYFACLPIIAEDLGIITPDVRETIHRFGFPGMKLLLFAFDESLPSNAYAPHNFTENCVAYTGTHDNNTVKGWFRHEADSNARKRLGEYLGREVTEKTVHLEMIRLAMMSVAKMVIIPMQDVLGLGETARMNLPATIEGNWGWRLRAEQITPALVKKLAEMTQIYGRA
jgi:4-alpha-glucanotransferase